MSSQFFRFLLTGGIAAGVNLGSRYLLNLVMRFELAVVLAYLAGMATAYVLARLFVFAPSGRSRVAEVRRFALVNLVSFCAVWAISVGLARMVFPALHFTWHADDIAHAIGVLSPAVASYIGHRFYTFAPSRG